MASAKEYYIDDEHLISFPSNLIKCETNSKVMACCTLPRRGEKKLLSQAYRDVVRPTIKIISRVNSLVLSANECSL